MCCDCLAAEGDVEPFGVPRGCVLTLVTKDIDWIHVEDAPSFFNWRGKRGVSLPKTLLRFCKMLLELLLDLVFFQSINLICELAVGFLVKFGLNTVG